jgi:hypothetical protein
MSEHQNDPQTLAMASMAEAVKQQTEAFVGAMAVQTEEIKRLSNKVDVMQSRVIRLEEQRHGKDIDTLTQGLSAANAKIATLELNWAEARGAGKMAGLLKSMAPGLIPTIVAALIYIGVEYGKKGSIGQ